MSAVPASPLIHTWPADLMAFAIQNKIDAYLDPLREALTKQFPTATKFQVLLEEDPEIIGDRYIVFEIKVPKKDVPDYLAAKRCWYDESFRICPAALIGFFRLSLHRVS